MKTLELTKTNLAVALVIASALAQPLHAQIVIKPKPTSPINSPANVPANIPMTMNVGSGSANGLGNGQPAGPLQQNNQMDLRAPTTLKLANTLSTYSSTDVFKATLTSNVAGQDLSNQPVDFYVDNIKVGTATTDLSGTAQFSYNPATPLFGSHNIYARYEALGSQKLAPSNAVGTLSIIKAATKINQEYLDAQYAAQGAGGYQFTASGMLTQVGANKPIPATAVSLMLDGVSIASTVTGPDGFFKFNVNHAVAYGMKSVQVAFDDNDHYTGSATKSLSIDYSKAVPISIMPAIVLPKLGEYHVGQPLTFSTMAFKGNNAQDGALGAKINFIVKPPKDPWFYTPSVTVGQNSLVTSASYSPLHAGKYAVVPEQTALNYKGSVGADVNFTVLKSPLTVQMTAAGKGSYQNGDSFPVNLKIYNKSFPNAPVDTNLTFKVWLSTPAGLVSVANNFHVGDNVFTVPAGIPLGTYGTSRAGGDFKLSVNVESNDDYETPWERGAGGDPANVFSFTVAP